MIQLFKPHMDEQEVEAVAEVIRSGWIGLGPRTAEFEKQFAEYIGASWSIGLNSCTAALDMAIRLLRINHGDEVIVPTMTFVSTAHAVAYNLATPVFVDIDETTLALDLEDVERKITPRTRAIIPVHYGGRPVDMDRLREVAGTIPIIEDAAHACGAEYKGQKCGTLGELACFSFHAVKNLATGDGGALTTNDQALAERAKRLRWLGIDRGTWDRTATDRSYWWQYFVDEVGLKCHMNDIMAAMGLVQLRKLDAHNERRRVIAEQYTAGLSDLPWLCMPPMDTDEIKSSWHIFWIQCAGPVGTRDNLNVFLQNRGIGTGVHYSPIHLYRCYGNTPYLPTAERVFTNLLSLPMHPGLSDDEVQFVIESIRAFPIEPMQGFLYVDGRKDNIAAD
jgi:perosamine synthetase